MIFVTLGLHKYQFDRLSDWIEKALKEGVITEEVFYQHGASRPVKHKLVTTKKGIPYAEYMKNLKNCSLAIVHASIGAFIELRETKKPFVMVPRKPELKEVADDNQTATARRFEREYDIEIAWEYDDFLRLINKGGVKFPQAASKSNQLINYLDTLVKDL